MSYLLTLSAVGTSGNGTVTVIQDYIIQNDSGNDVTFQKNDEQNNNFDVPGITVTGSLNGQVLAFIASDDIITWATRVDVVRMPNIVIPN